MFRKSPRSLTVPIVGLILILIGMTPLTAMRSAFASTGSTLNS